MNISLIIVYLFDCLIAWLARCSAYPELFSVGCFLSPSAECHQCALNISDSEVQWYPAVPAVTYSIASSARSLLHYLDQTVIFLMFLRVRLYLVVSCRPECTDLQAEMWRGMNCSAACSNTSSLLLHLSSVRVASSYCLFSLSSLSFRPSSIFIKHLCFLSFSLFVSPSVSFSFKVLLFCLLPLSYLIFSLIFIVDWEQEGFLLWFHLAG